MAAIMGVSRADVVEYDTDGTTELARRENVNALARGGVATLRNRAGGILVEKVGVLAVERPRASGDWRVTFADGTVWTVAKNRDCGCAGTRKRA